MEILIILGAIAVFGTLLAIGSFVVNQLNMERKKTGTKDEIFGKRGYLRGKDEFGDIEKIDEFSQNFKKYFNHTLPRYGDPLHKEQRLRDFIDNWSPISIPNLPRRHIQNIDTIYCKNALNKKLSNEKLSEEPHYPL